MRRSSSRTRWTTTARPAVELQHARQAFKVSPSCSSACSQRTGAQESRHPGSTVEPRTGSAPRHWAPDGRGQTHKPRFAVMDMDSGHSVLKPRSCSSSSRSLSAAHDRSPRLRGARRASPTGVGAPAAARSGAAQDGFDRDHPEEPASAVDAAINMLPSWRRDTAAWCPGLSTLTPCDESRGTPDGARRAAHLRPGAPAGRRGVAASGRGRPHRRRRAGQTARGNIRHQGAAPKLSQSPRTYPRRASAASRSLGQVTPSSRADP